MAKSTTKRQALQPRASVRTRRRALRHTLHKRTASADATVVATIGLAVILLFVIGGVGAYLMVGRVRTESLREATEAEVELAHAESNVDKVWANARELDDGDSIRSAVEAVLRIQEEAWNRGDVDAFVDHYWKSEELTFSSGGKTTRGWQQTLDRYRQRYPTLERMGRLRMSGLEITPLGDAAAMVLGQWNLERAGDPVSGNFTLVLRKFGDRWLIVHDHTSRLTE